MVRILIGVPMFKPHPRFLESLRRFFNLAVLSHKIELKIVRNKSLVNAQNEIANYFIQSDYDYLLFLEDDHWGHSVEMLNTLIDSNKQVCGIKYFSRHYPYVCCQMVNGMNVISPKSGCKPVTVTGFGMTLITKEVFIRLDKPYFRVNKKGEGFATDKDFCERLIKLGIQPYGCFDYCLIHRGIDEVKASELRDNSSNGLTSKRLMYEFKFRHEKHNRIKK